METAAPFGDAVDTERFWQDMRQQANIGALPGGGLGRLALDDNDIKARLWLIQCGQEIGCDAYYDEVGNVYLRREGRSASAMPLLIGSHLDSQPLGGAYDGTLGVVAGLSVLRTLHEQGSVHARPVEVVSWTNEEGARFSPGTPGSSWFAGTRDMATIGASRDDHGMSFAAALAPCLEALAASGAHLRESAFTPHAYLEMHIEQGPILDATNVPMAAVSGIQGVHWYRFTLSGVANHAGTTPRAMRCDAFMAAHALVTALIDTVGRYDERVRFTIGKFSLTPNSVNTIADQATFTVDLRHPDAQVLTSLDDDFQRLASAPWEGCPATLEVMSRLPPVTFDQQVVERLEHRVHAYVPKAPRLVSGAFHDAIHMAHLCPTAMLFVACRGGISHHPNEHVEAEDAACAVRALAQTAHDLIQR